MNSNNSVEEAEQKTVRITIDTQSIHGEDETVLYESETGDELSVRYDVIKKIGQGGMGDVYIAHDRRLGRYVAVKRLNLIGRESPSMKDRFFHEGRAVAVLNHIHIVHIYSLGEDKNGPYIVMEYVAGPKSSTRKGEPPPAYTLADRIDREGALALDAALDMLIKLCRAIEYAHGHAVIHRDLKPTNILLDESGEPKIVDFGLARVRRADVQPLTLPGEKMLSLGYGAPEQEVDASQSDERVDVYGLGALLYFCITGKNPRYFRQNDLPEVLRMPVIKALETDREQRWDSVKSFRKALMLIKSPSKKKLSTSKVIWHCKWCDTANPIEIRYCGKCGWDGGSHCPECGSESRFGVQFCGVCGADAKAYENVQRVLDDMLKNMQQKEFGLVGHEQSRIAGFRSQGVNGRALIDRVHHLAAQAARSLRRRGTLREEIKREFKEGNYELVRRLIREYSELSFSDEFAEMQSKLDDLQNKRDLARLQDLVSARHWSYAERLYESLKKRGGIPMAEAEVLFRRIRRHYRIKKSLRWSGGIAIAMVVYMLSGPPLYRVCGRPQDGLIHVFYAPLSLMIRLPVLRYSLLKYAEAYDAADMFENPRL